MVRSREIKQSGSDRCAMATAFDPEAGKAGIPMASRTQTEMTVSAGMKQAGKGKGSRLAFRCLCSVSALALLAMLLPSPAQADEVQPGFFAKGRLSLGIGEESDGDVSNSTLSSTADPGVTGGLGAGFGYRFHDLGSVELEGDWSMGETEESYGGLSASGTAGQVGLFANGYFHVPMDGPVRPWIGAGIGGVHNYGEDQDGGMGLAFQGMVGVDVPVSQDMALRAGYRYRNADPGEYNSGGVTRDYDRSGTHAVDVGLVWSFGSGETGGRTASATPAVNPDMVDWQESPGAEPGPEMAGPTGARNKAGPTGAQTASRGPAFDLENPPYDHGGGYYSGASMAPDPEEFSDPAREALAPLDSMGRAGRSGGADPYDNEDAFGQELVPAPPAEGEPLERYGNEPFPGQPRYGNDPFATGLEPALPVYTNAALSGETPAGAAAGDEASSAPYQVASWKTGTPSYMADSRDGGRDGGYAVQLASYKDAGNADAGWKDLQARYHDLLAGMTPVLRKTDVQGKGVYHRLYTGGLDRQAAEGLCRSLKKRGQWCKLTRLPG